MTVYLSVIVAPCLTRTPRLFMSACAGVCPPAEEFPRFFAPSCKCSRLRDSLTHSHACTRPFYTDGHRKMYEYLA